MTKHSKRALIIIGVIILTPKAITTTVMALEGLYQFKTTFENTSPDGRMLLRISERASFIAMDFIDWATVLKVTLHDVGSDRLLDRQRVSLMENSDYQEPTITWGSNAVEISGYDKRHADRRVSLRDSRPNRRVE